jgi:hypothetical protein
VATILAFQTLTVRADIAPADVEALFEKEILPAAADTPGSVSRANRSTIASQHLLRRSGSATEYLWIVKSSGVFALDGFETVAERLSEDAAEKLDQVCERSPMTVWTQTLSYDQGPRDLGGPTGEPRRDVDL